MLDLEKHCWLSYIIDDYALIISSYFPLKENYMNKLANDDYYRFFNVSEENINNK